MKMIWTWWRWSGPDEDGLGQMKMSSYVRKSLRSTANCTEWPKNTHVTIYMLRLSHLPGLVLNLCSSCRVAYFGQYKSDFSHFLLFWKGFLRLFCLHAWRFHLCPININPQLHVSFIFLRPSSSDLSTSVALIPQHYKWRKVSPLSLPIHYLGGHHRLPIFSIV